jgi:hypothetical protein
MATNQICQVNGSGCKGARCTTCNVTDVTDAQALSYCEKNLGK